MNQIIPKSALKFTKGEDQLKKYAYKGDSGKSFVPSSSPPFAQTDIIS